jgi:hypothetical protein
MKVEGFYYTNTDHNGDNYLNLQAYFENVEIDASVEHEVSWILMSDEHPVSDQLTCSWFVPDSD